MLKWEIKLQRERIGLWRPKLTVRWWVEGDEWKELNVDPIVDLRSLKWAKAYPSFIHCWSCDRCKNEFPIQLYTSANVHGVRRNDGENDDEDERKCPHVSIDLSKDGGYEWSAYLFFATEEKEYEKALDFLVKNYCAAVAEEYERRLEEARKSQLINVTITGCSNEVANRTTASRTYNASQLAQRAFRKLRIA